MAWQCDRCSVWSADGPKQHKCIYDEAESLRKQVKDITYLVDCITNIECCANAMYPGCRACEAIDNLVHSGIKIDGPGTSTYRDRENKARIVQLEEALWAATKVCLESQGEDAWTKADDIKKHYPKEHALVQTALEVWRPKHEVLKAIRLAQKTLALDFCPSYEELVKAIQALNTEFGENP